MQPRLGKGPGRTKRNTIMARIITIELPDSIEISGAKDAPEKFRVVSTAKWDAEFCLTAL